MTNARKPLVCKEITMSRVVKSPLVSQTSEIYVCRVALMCFVCVYEVVNEKEMIEILLHKFLIQNHK